MATFIYLHELGGDAVVVNADAITWIKDLPDGGSKVHFEAAVTKNFKENGGEIAKLAATTR